MDNKTLAQLYEHAVEQGDSSGEKEYGDQILAIKGFNAEGISADSVYRTRLSKLSRSISSLTSKKTKSNEALVLDELQRAEEIYAKLTNKEDGGACANLGASYCNAALCYKANKDGQAKIAALVERAKKNGLPLSHLSKLCENRGLSEQLRQEINDAIQAQGKANFDKKQIESLQHNLPEIHCLDSVATAALIEGRDIGAAILPLKEQDFCVELFKKAVLSKVGDEAALTAFKAKEAKIEVEKLFVPIGIVKWEATSAHYRWSWRTSDGAYSANGSFDYGGASTVACHGLAGDGNSLLGSSAERFERELRNGYFSKEPMIFDASYAVPHFDDLLAPREIVHTLQDAKNALAKERGYDSNDYNLKVEAVTKASYLYDLKGVQFVPYYAIRIVSGGYVAKGTINAYYTDIVNVDDVAKVEGSYESFVGKRFAGTKFVKPPKRHIGLKVVSGICSLAALIVMILSLATGMFGGGMLTYAFFAAIPAALSFVLCLAAKKKVFWGVVSIVIAAVVVILAIVTMLGGSSSVSAAPEALINYLNI